MSLPLLSLLETRVLGVLVEKQYTVPDTYPLTLNALVSGCNQKTSRDPVLNATDAEVQAAIDHLRTLSLIVESSGGRVQRYAHNTERVLGLPTQSVALLSTLMLRGPQTAAELRANSERLHRFADASAVEGFLHELAERSAGALVLLLPRAPGSREPRWAHLLSGPPVIDYTPAVNVTEVPADVTVGEIVAMKANIDQLTTEVEALRATVARICSELGIPAP